MSKILRSRFFIFKYTAICAVVFGVMLLLGSTVLYNQPNNELANFSTEVLAVIFITYPLVVAVWLIDHLKLETFKK